MLNIHAKRLKISLLIALASCFSACGKKSNRKSVIDPPQRSGTAFVSYSLKYSDQDPVLSANGEKVAFISGRDSDENNSILKAYKFSWAASAAPDPTGVSRVTNVDLGRETVAAISPDGKWIAVVASSSSETSIYIQAFDETGGERLVAKTSSSIANLSFSPDSRLLMWLVRSQSQVTVNVADIGTVSTDPVSEVQSPESVVYAADAEWVSVGTGYSFVVAESGSESAVILNQYSFTAIDQIKAMTPVKMLESQLYNKSVPMVANAGYVGFVSKVARSSRLLVPRYGKVEDPQPSIPVANQPQWFVPGAEAAVSGTETPFSYDTTDLAIGIDASLLSLNKTYYYCEGDTASTFGSDIASINLTDKAVVRMVPRLNAAADGFVMASGLCDNLDADGVKRRMDDRVTEIALSGNSTAATFRMAYVTRISTKFDANCALKLGDPDIYLVEGTAETKTIYHLSGNQVPLENDTRAEPCSL